MTATTESKTDLRRRLRAERIAHANALPPQVSALVFHRPPSPVLNLVAPGTTIGLYHPTAGEAPTAGYARYFLDRGHAIALPWFASRTAPMEFRAYSDSFEGADLGPGPWGPQPVFDAPRAEPDVLFVPLVAFTADGHRLGQGGGHYDRWLAAHPGAVPIGLAWDMQEVTQIESEAHDIRMHAVVTPTRVLGPFA